MPELPEVESIRIYIHDLIIGKEIKSIDVFATRMIIGDQNNLINAKVHNTYRKGKVLSIHFKKNGEDLHASFHLKLSGQILYAENKDNAKFKRIIPRAKSDIMPGASTRIIIYFKDNSAIYFNDIRKLGWMAVSNKPVEPKGVDVLSKDFTYSFFEKIIKKYNRPVKNTLLDQDLIAGLGNIYTNDALWEAKINPQRKTSSLNDLQIKTLYKSVVNTINLGIEKKGSSAQDEIYLLPDGTPGQYQHYFKVYGRKGGNCLGCNDSKIEYIKMQGRGTFYCPNCQK